MKTIFVVFAFVLAIAFAEEVGESEAAKKYDAALNELNELHKQMSEDRNEELEKQYDEKHREVLNLQAEWQKEQLATASEEDKPFLEKSIELNSVAQQLHSNWDNDELRDTYDKLLAELSELKH